MGSTSGTFSISYMLNSGNRVVTRYFNQYFSNVKILFADSLTAEQTTYSTEQISIFLKLLFGHFMGNPVLTLFEVL